MAINGANSIYLPCRCTVLKAGRVKGVHRRASMHPEGMEADAHLLAQYAQVPSISKAWIRQASADAACVSVWSPFHGCGIHAYATFTAAACMLMHWSPLVLNCSFLLQQVQYSQRNMAANAQRKYVVTHFVNGVSEAMNANGVPVELKDVILYSPSPSGRVYQCQVI